MSKPKLDRAVNVPNELIKELLTDSELRMVKQRMLIIKLLEEGLSIRAVAQRARVGTDTVVRISRKLESSQLLRQAFRQLSQQTPQSTWIFGKSETET